MIQPSSFTVKGNLVDIIGKRIFAAEVMVKDGKIESIQELGNEVESNIQGFILPGFIDSHVHIESSMLIPSEFARLAVVHGTVATVSDPHEIANVCGLKALNYMIENGKKVPFKFQFWCPKLCSCNHF